METGRQHCVSHHWGCHRIRDLVIHWQKIWVNEDIRPENYLHFEASVKVKPVNGTRSLSQSTKGSEIQTR